MPKRDFRYFVRNRVQSDPFDGFGLTAADAVQVNTYLQRILKSLKGGLFRKAIDPVSLDALAADLYLAYGGRMPKDVADRICRIDILAQFGVGVRQDGMIYDADAEKGTDALTFKSSNVSDDAPLKTPSLPGSGSSPGSLDELFETVGIKSKSNPSISSTEGTYRPLNQLLANDSLLANGELRNILHNAQLPRSLDNLVTTIRTCSKPECREIGLSVVRQADDIERRFGVRLVSHGAITFEKCSPITVRTHLEWSAQETKDRTDLAALLALTFLADCESGKIDIRDFAKIEYVWTTLTQHAGAFPLPYSFGVGRASYPVRVTFQEADSLTIRAALLVGALVARGDPESRLAANSIREAQGEHHGALEQVDDAVTLFLSFHGYPKASQFYTLAYVLRGGLASEEFAKDMTHLVDTDDPLDLRGFDLDDLIP